MTQLDTKLSDKLGLKMIYYSINSSMTQLVSVHHLNSDPSSSPPRFSSPGPLLGIKGANGQYFQMLCMHLECTLQICSLTKMLLKRTFFSGKTVSSVWKISSH